MNGCAVLDMGAQTTTLTVYKGGQYLANRVVPKGGYHITRMLEQQGMSFRTAEVLKCRYGIASPALVERNVRLRVPAAPGMETQEMVITTEQLAEAIEMKLREILAPLIDELKKAESRIQTLYITGGASMLTGMVEYLQQQTRVRVQYGAHNLLLHRDTDEQYLSPEYSSLVGTLLLGQDYRDSHKNQPIRTPNLLERMKNGTLEIFLEE